MVHVRLPPAGGDPSPHSCQQEVKHAVLSHGNAGGVGKVNEPPHHLGADVTQSHLRGTALFETAGEHGFEV